MRTSMRKRLLTTRQFLLLRLLIVSTCVTQCASIFGGSLRTTVGDKLEYRLYYSWSWGAVCSSGFDDNAALVACRQLGYDDGSYYTSAYFGFDSIAVYSTSCAGFEIRFDNCILQTTSYGWYYETCSSIVHVRCDYNNTGSGDSHDNDNSYGSGVDPYIIYINNTNGGDDNDTLEIGAEYGYVGYGDLRTYGYYGDKRLEFRLSNYTWGSVCGLGFDYNAAQVACRQLGYDGLSYHTQRFGSHNCSVCSIDCYGNESRLADCNIQICSQNFHSYLDGAVFISCLDTWSPTTRPTSFSFSTSDTVSPSLSSDVGGSDGDNGRHLGAIVGGLVSFFIASIVIVNIIIILFIMKKRKPSRRTVRVTVAQQQQTSQRSTESASARTLDEPPPYNAFSARQTVRGTVATPPKTSAEWYTNPVPPQASVQNQTHSNPVYTQRQTESATAVGSTSIVDEPPPYSAFNGECAPDGCVSDQLALHDDTLSLPPPDYTSIITIDPSVPV